MKEINTAISTEDNNTIAHYDLISTGRALSIKIVQDAFHKMEVQPNCLNSNFLNHWIDHSQVSRNEVSLSTQLNNNEQTIADFKASVTGASLDDFKDNMLGVFKAFVKFAYYMELGKEWATPINPLNLIYVDNTDGTGSIKAFYHKSKPIKNVDANFLNNVIKMIVYIFLPEEENTANLYPDLSAKNYYDKFEDDVNLISKYGAQPIEDLSTNVLNFQQSADGNRISSVKDIFQSFGGEEIAKEIEQAKGVVSATKPNNLNQFASEEERKRWEDTLNQQKAGAVQDDYRSPKDAKLAKLKKAQAEKQKQKEAKKEAKRKAREERLAKQNQAKNQSQQTDGAEENLDKPLYKKPLFIAATIAGLLLLTGGGVMLHNHNVAQQKIAQQAKAKEVNPNTSSDFRNGAAATGAANYKAGAKSFDNFFQAGGNLNTLNNNQIGSVFSAYFNTQQYQKILDNIGNQQSATAVINYLVAHKKNNVINNLNSKQPIVSLAKANINHDYQGIVQQANKCDITQNGTLQLAICKGYAKTKQLADGKKWAEQQKNSQKLIKAIKTYAGNDGVSNKIIASQMD